MTFRFLSIILMISSSYLPTFSDPLTIIGFALAALLTVIAALLLLVWRSFQTSKLAIRKAIPAGIPASPFTAALTRYIIQQAQQFLDVETVLIQAEADYRGIYENAIEGIFRSTPDGRYLSVNPTLAKMHGYRSSDEMMAMVTDCETQIYVAPGRRAEFLHLINQLQVLTEFVSEVYRKDGSTFWISENVQIVRDASGTVYYQGTSLDISEAKRDEFVRTLAEESLRQSEERFRAIFEQAAVGIAETDLSGNYIRVNQRFCELVGYSQAELLTLSFRELTHPDDLVLDEDCEEKLFSKQAASVFMEKRFVAKDGQVRWANVSVSLVKNLDGSPACTVAIVEDIDSRQQAEEALRQSEQRFRSVFDQIEIGMNFAHLSGTYFQVNPALCNLVGYSEAELLGMSYQDLTHPEDQEKEMLLAAQIQAGDLQTYSLEKRYVRKDGQIRWVNVHVSSVRDSQENILFATAMVEDIGDRKLTEESLRQSEARNSAIVSAVPDVLVRMDETGRYLDVVEGQNVELMKPADGFDNKTMFDILPQHLAQQRMGFVQQALKTGQMQVYEHQIEVNGGLYDEETRITMISENEVLVIVRDISEAKRAAALLQRQANREQALNHLTQAIRNSLELKTIFSTAVLEIGTLLQLDRVSVVKWFPDQGYWQALEEYLQTSDQILSLNEKIPDEANPIAAQLKQGKIVKIDDSITCADAVNQDIATRYPGGWLLIPLQVEGKVWGSLTLMRLQTETHLLWQDAEVDLACAVADQLAIAIQQSQLYQRVQQLNVHLEQEVQQRTAQLRQALSFEALLKRITDKVRDSLDEDQILQAAVDDLGQGLQVECCNAAIYDLTLTSHTITHEYSIAQPFALGKQMAFADCPAIEIFDQLIQAICFQFCFTVETYTQPQGEIYTILACPILDDQGILGDLWLYRPKQDTFDESEIRLVQQVANQCAIALRQSRLYQAAQLQVQELERLNGLKDDFLNTVSHELRTPMATIKMATQMLEISLEQPISSDDANRNGDRIGRYLQILKEECQRETSLINDLLDLSRLDSGSEPLLPLTHHLQYWIPHITESFTERTYQQQQQLSITIDDELPTLTTDFNYLEMILTELLHNACKYTPLGEAIVVSAKPEPTALGVILAIANSGVEIPETELKHVFDKFYRVPNNDPWKHGGTGLGLALVKKRVERLNGAIAVASQNGWTTFTIHLPLQSQ